MRAIVAANRRKAAQAAKEKAAAGEGK
jgi:hypothetical protein